MNFRIYSVVCWALLVGFATAASQNTQRGNSGFTFKDSDADADIEGSGFDGEVNRDLESSGSGAGPDDEDNDDSSSVDTNIRKVEDGIGKATKLPDETIPKTNMPTEPSPTEDSGVVKNPNLAERPITSFFSQPGILAAVIGGAVVGLLCAILVVMFIVYRMRKKDEGSYALGEPKQSPNSNSYSRGNNKEFYA